jgi:uncharacterized protein (DUF58 family)
VTIDFDQHLHRLQLRCRRNVDQLLAGHYRSVFKGRGLEFDEVRPYQHGDDTRSIDWNVTARSGVTFIKRYHEERELSIMLVVDVSGSSHYGTSGRSKRETMLDFCAHLAFTAQRNHDRFGLILCSDQVELYLPPTSGKSGVMRLLRELLEFTPTSTGTNLSRALSFLANLRLRRSMVFVLSDFQDQGYLEDLGMLAVRHEVVAVAVDDPREKQLPAVGLIRLRDVENGQSTTVDLNSAISRKTFATQRHEQDKQREQVLREAGADYLALQTDRECVEDLLAFFNSRERRIADETGG